MEEIYPELIVENKDSGIKSVNYNGLSAVLIECVKSLKQENRELKEALQKVSKVQQKSLKKWTKENCSYNIINLQNKIQETTGNTRAQNRHIKTLYSLIRDLYISVHSALQKQYKLSSKQVTFRSDSDSNSASPSPTAIKTTNNFLAIPFFLKSGFTKIYSTSPTSLKRTNPIVVFMFLRVKIPSASVNSYFEISKSLINLKI
mgnify:CR=1 FL=1